MGLDFLKDNKIEILSKVYKLHNDLFYNFSIFCFLIVNLLSTVLSTKKPSPFSHYYVCILKDHINVCVMLVCCWRWMFVCFSIFIFMAIYILFDQKPFWRFDSSKITARYWTKKTMMIPFKALYHKSYPTYSKTIEEKYSNYLQCTIESIHLCKIHHHSEIYYSGIDSRAFFLISWLKYCFKIISSKK